MNFYFQPRTQAYKNWEQIKIGDKVLYKGAFGYPATVRNIYYYDRVVIEFDNPVPPVFITTHDCCEEVPSGNGYFVFYTDLIEKIIE